ncbi:MAG: hypothetical protein F4Y86_18870 [Gammaproteobacteria bacterium]|nr:hypothetical protein [Gammaproteobacteria bacterium]MYB39213.1 hypothetical protein [Gammaproteobacteria bacterium]
MNRWFALAVLLLGVGFLGRVAGQFIQVLAPVEFLPPLDAWQGSNLPYPVLFAVQMAIVVLIAFLSARMAAGRPILSPRMAAPVIALAAIYFSVMSIRLVLGLTATAHVKWFASPIPATFHLVLAIIALATGIYARVMPAGRSK